MTTQIVALHRNKKLECLRTCVGITLYYSPVCVHVCVTLYLLSGTCKCVCHPSPYLLSRMCTRECTPYVYMCACHPVPTCTLPYVYMCVCVTCSYSPVCVHAYMYISSYLLSHSTQEEQQEQHLSSQAPCLQPVSPNHEHCHNEVYEHF